MKTFVFLGLVGILCLAVGCESIEDEQTGDSISTLEQAIVAPSTVTDSGKSTGLIESPTGSIIEFSMVVEKTGSYFVRVWGSGLATATTTTMYVDDKPMGKLRMQDTGWQYHDVSALNSKNLVKLAAGKHTFGFTNNVDRAPEIERVQIASSRFPLDGQKNVYAEYIEGLKQSVLPLDYDEKKRAALDGDPDKGSTNASPGSKGNYCYSESLQFNYTFRMSVWHNAGESVSYSTLRSDGNQLGSDPVMYITYESNPSISWYNDDYNGYQPRISISSVPNTGWYTILIRAYNSDNPGTTDFYKNDILQQSNIAVAGRSVYCYLYKTGTLNYFTANLNSGGDSYIFLIDSQMSIAAYNDDFWGSSDFNWGWSSRIHGTFSNQFNRLVVSTYNSSNPWGMADVYLQNEDSDIMPWFENLDAIDAIESAPSDNYNCIAWSGGVDWDWIWPPSQVDGGVWYDADPQKAFDNWYGNHVSNGTYYPRYSGAWYYDRAGATEANSVVDVWAYPGGSYTHGSVRAKGNAHLHGYDWESKPGGLTRTFHPRNALHGASYGEIYQYYFGAGSTSVAGTLSEAVAAGTDVIEKVSLTSDETRKLSALKAALPAETVQEFEMLYSAWKKTWSDPKIAIYSDPAKYTESMEYTAVSKLCRSKGKALWPLAFEKVFEGDIFVRLLVSDLTFPEYQSTFESIRNDHQTPRYTADGKFIVTLPSVLMKKYIRELLADL